MDAFFQVGMMFVKDADRGWAGYCSPRRSLLQDGMMAW